MKKYELFKSILLFLLVTISGILTWNLWTYQPAYNEIENTEYIQQDITISPKRELEDHIRPVKVLYHEEGQDYGSTSEEHITKWMTEMKKWSFYNFRNVSSSIPKQEFLSFVHGKDSVEIVYPDEIPIQTFELMFQVNEKSLPSIYFDHVVLKPNKGQGVDAYFIDYDHRKIYESSIKNLTREDLERINQGVKKEYDSYFPYKIKGIRTLFLPEGEIEINRIQYYTRKIETEKFRDALFSDPSYVKKKSSLSYSGDFYTDGSRILGVDSSINVMDYVNPAISNNRTMDSHTLLKRSFSFVNDHGGWTDAYRFASWNREEQEVVYRLYEDNYPVFNSQGMTEVFQRWGNNEIIQYRRPIYFFIKLPLDSYPVKLPPGDEIIERIEEQQPEFNPSLLKDVVVGYELVQEDQESKVVSLEPAWYYLYNQQKWTKVEKKPIGGKWNGLE
ncbi:YycH family regulatory protein [Bacillus songklensis]|uniref:YycH family regulatory protein n=1 Tax=Bacillus songklensis TaxID=1069116 RepID=A0ABV8B7M2_9BACI